MAYQFTFSIKTRGTLALLAAWLVLCTLGCNGASFTATDHGDTSGDSARTPSPGPSEGQTLGGSGQHRAKYVFFFIGDGMGANQVRLAELFLEGRSGIGGKPGEMSTTVFTGFPVRTEVTTFSANSAITDSAAAGTALATGHKTRNDVIAKSPSLQDNYISVAAQAKKRGYKVGILTSVSLDHATPAVFYAHQNHRGMYHEIALDLATSNFDYFGGGGFISPRGKSGDGQDAFEAATKQGYQIVAGREALFALSRGTGKTIAMHPALLGQAEMPWAMEAAYGELSLSELVQKGATLLQNPRGFFMMAEGGKIDWACHENDGAAVVHEILAFNDAVNAAMTFYAAHKGETLIVVTADHETGGLGLGNNTTPMSLHPARLQYQKLALGTLNAAIGDQIKKGATFEEILAFLTAQTGLGDATKGLALSQMELAMLKNAYAHMTNPAALSQRTMVYGDDKGRGGQIGSLAVDLVNQKAGIGWSSLSHSAARVPLYAIGAGQELFSAPLDNTEIPGLILKAMGL